MEINYNGNVIDPIHGLIRLTDIEKWFLYQEQFTRLRFIKQNTFVFYVFPSANHTRFEHSIGVMDIATRMLQSCIENERAGRYRQEKHEKGNNLKDFEFLKLNESYESEMFDVHTQEMRLAALLHDVGHGPFSHKFDDYTLTKSEFLNLLTKSPYCTTRLKSFEDLLKDKDGQDRIDHEVVSCYFILELVGKLKKDNADNPKKFVGSLKKMVNAISGERIVRMVEPKMNFGTDGLICCNGIDFSKFYSTIISSFPIDADRMDYLLRDGQFTGVKYGIYDLSRILISLVPVKNGSEAIIAVKESGIDAIVRFIESRTHLFNIVYSHKTNVAANVMLDYIFRGFKNRVLKADDYESMQRFYWENSDEYFLRKTVPLEVIANQDRSEQLTSIHKWLMQRRLWKRIFNLRFSLASEYEQQDRTVTSRIKRIKELSDQINIELYEKCDIAAGCNVFVNDLFKDSNKTSLNIIRKNQDKEPGKTMFELDKKWRWFNQELKSLDYKTIIFQLYMERSFSSSEEFELQKSRVLEIVKDKLENMKDLAGI